MKIATEQTNKILYNGKNHDLVHKHFKKWEIEWNFNTKLYTHHHNSYEETMSGNVLADLLINENNGSKPFIIPYDRQLSFININDEIVILIEPIV